MWNWLLNLLPWGAIPAWAAAWFGLQRRREEVAARKPQFELRLRPCEGFTEWFEIRLSITNRLDASMQAREVEVVKPVGAGLLDKIELEDQGELRPAKAKRFLPLRTDIGSSSTSNMPPFFVHAPPAAGAQMQLVLRVKCLHRGRAERAAIYKVKAGLPSN